MELSILHLFLFSFSVTSMSFISSSHSLVIILLYSTTTLINDACRDCSIKSFQIIIVFLFNLVLVLHYYCYPKVIQIGIGYILHMKLIYSLRLLAYYIQSISMFVDHSFDKKIVNNDTC